MQHQSSSPTLTAQERILSACAGATLTSLLVTPLDVVKTRLQSQPKKKPGGSFSSTLAVSPNHSSNPPCSFHTIPWNSPSTDYPSSYPVSYSNPPRTRAFSYSSCIRNSCAEVFFSKAPKSCVLRPAHLFKEFSPSISSVGTPTLNGTWDALVKIARYEGILTLWRGLCPTLLMSLPANVIYFMVYDTLRDFLSKKLERTSLLVAVPLISGASARVMAATMISPIELLRTQMQGPNASTTSVAEMIRRIRWQVKVHQGPRYLWRGLGATLWRDVPFSGIYWITYEQLKRRLAKIWPDSHFHIAFTAGAMSGMLAASVTAPFDVAKTRRQLSHRGHDTVWFMLKHIVQHEGAPGLFAGVIPRVVKVAPACAIMVGTYEYAKFFFSELRHSGSSTIPAMQR